MLLYYYQYKRVRSMRLLPVIFGLILLGCGEQDGSKADTPQTCNVLVTWEPQLTRFNGHPISLEELKKYTIYVNLTKDPTKENTLILVADVTDMMARSWVLEGVHKGTIWVYLTVTDTEGRISPYSNVLNLVCK